MRAQGFSWPSYKKEERRLLEQGEISCGKRRTSEEQELREECTGSGERGGTDLVGNGGKGKRAV